MGQEKERLRKLVDEQKERMEQPLGEEEKEAPDSGVDYAQLYREQTGRDFISGEYTVQ